MTSISLASRMRKFLPTGIVRFTRKRPAGDAVSRRLRQAVDSVVEPLEQRWLLSAIAIWHFDEAAGSLTAADSAAGTHVATLGGDNSSSATFSGGRNGAGNALTLDGTGYATLSDADDLEISGPITLSAWVKPDSSGGMQYILANGSDGGADPGVFLRINNGSYEVGGMGTSLEVASGAIPSGDVGQWVHLAGTYDGANWRLYRDGVQIASALGSVGASGSALGWYMGARDTSADHQGWTGKIDDARIDDGALTQDQIEQAAGLPAEWTDADVGSPGAPGGAAFDGTTWFVSGAGSDIWNNADQFSFASEAIDGDGSIVARVTGQDASSAWAKSGVMMRSDGSAGSAYAAVVATPGGNVNFQWRAAADGACNWQTVGGISGPVSVRLTRRGGLFIGSYSLDGANWSDFSSEPVAMPSAALIGLAVTSQSNNTLNNATFDNVQVQQAPGVPSGWSDFDIGSPGISGSATYDGTNWTVNGGGSDIWNNADQFNFASEVLNGSGQIVTRIDTQDDTSSWAKAGVMIRNDSTAGSTYVAVVATPGGNVNFQWRATADGGCNWATVAGTTKPVWLKLVRIEDRFSGYYSSDGANWTQIGSTLSLTMPAGVQAGLAVTSQNNGLLGSASFSELAVTSLNLPDGWSDADIGSPGQVGQATFDGTTWTIDGGGSDIWNNADQFNFVSKAMDGNGSIIARVTGQNVANAWAKSGVMVRGDATAGSAYAAVVVTPGGNVNFQWRATEGGACNWDTVSGVSAPLWVKLTREGGMFSGYYSTDGTTWTQLGSASVPIPSAALAGLAVTAQNNSALNTATFDSVLVEQAPPLPSGWSDLDVGQPGIAGAGSFDGATWTVRGSGSDIWNNADQFNFTSQSLGGGSGEIIAKITSQSSGSAWAKSGVMIRNDSSAGSAYAAVVVTPGGNVNFQWRAAADGGCNWATVAGINAPVWVRLTRVGGTFSGAYSLDGTTWTAVGSPMAIAMSDTVLIGLAVTSQSNDALNTTTFTDLSVNPLSLPAGWTGANLAASDPSGGAAFNGTAWTINSSTALAENQCTWIYSGAATDGGHSIYQDLGDNQQIVAQVRSQQDAGAWTKSGLMIRASNDADARFVGVFVTPEWGVLMIQRSTAAALTQPVAYDSAYGNQNVWLKLTKVHDAVTAYVSRDGAAWSEIGQVTLDLGATPVVGLLADSGTAGMGAASTFSDVSIGALTNTATVPQIPYNLMAEAYSGTDGRVVWPPIKGAQSITVQQSRDGGQTFADVAVVPAGADTFLPDGLSPSTTYQYRIRATNANGDSAWSAPVSLTTRATPTFGYYSVAVGNPYKLVTAYEDTMSVQVARVPTAAASWQQAYFVNASGSATNTTLGNTYSLGNFRPVASNRGYYGNSFGFLVATDNAVAFNDTAGQAGGTPDQKDWRQPTGPGPGIHSTGDTGGDRSSGGEDESENNPPTVPNSDGDPVSYGTGATVIYSMDLSSSAFTGAWSITRNWTAQTRFVSDNTFGNGWMNQNQMYLHPMQDSGDHADLMLVNSAYTQGSFLYDAATDSYVPRAMSKDSLVHDSASGRYVWTHTSDGSRGIFYDFDASTPAALQGKLQRWMDVGGDQIDLSYNGNGQLTLVTQTDVAGNKTFFAYTYFGGGANAGQISSIQQSLQRLGDSGASLVRQAAYSYYQGTYTDADAFGNRGDLRTVQVEDADGNVLDTYYYRYYTPSDLDAGEQGFAGGLKYAFSPDGFAKLSVALTHPLTAGDAAVASYADEFYAYDAERRVIQEAVGSMGASAGDGLGTYTFDYYANPNFPAINTTDFNTWWMRTAVTLPNGNQHVAYSNVNSDTLLYASVDLVDQNSPGNVGHAWIMGCQYDAQGRLVTTVSPSAINDSFYLNLTDTANFEQYADLGLSEGGVLANSGLVYATTYYGSTTATQTAPGGVKGYVQADYLRRGLAGTPIEQDSFQYLTLGGGTDVRYVLADSTRYRNSDGSGAQTTNYSYTLYAGTNAIYMTTITLPLVTTAENGSGTVATSTEAFDRSGRVIWRKDPDGFLDYTAYDGGTGAMTERITDVDTGKSGEFIGLPSGWTTPTGGGLNLITRYQVDNLGRTTQETSPEGRVTDWVYADLAHAVFVLPGVQETLDGNGDGTLTTTGPIAMGRTRIGYLYDQEGGQRAGLYDEMLSFSGTLNVSNGRFVLPNWLPDQNVLDLIGNGDAAHPQFVIQNLSRDLYNSTGLAGQLIESDAYNQISSADYVATPLNNPYTTGAAGSFYVRTYAYDNWGQWYQSVDATGTIRQTLYDGLGRAVSLWTGTTLDNLVQTEARQYDNDGVGDGNLTADARFPGGTQAPRETQYLYDWRNRLVSIKGGAQASEGAATNRPLTVLMYDNLNEVTRSDTYDGDGVAMNDANTDGVPDSLSADLLRARSESSYDELGQDYQDRAYSVDPSTGALGDPVISDHFYNRRGHLIESVEIGGSAGKYGYDGAGRLTFSYQSDGGVLNNAANAGAWAAAGSVAGDVVLSQIQYLYDGDGNVIETIRKDRFHDDGPATGALGDAGGIGGPAARVSYAASYYDAANRDIADVNVGTNGDAAWTRPAAVPARSDDVLVSSYAYDDAGRPREVTDPRGIIGRTEYDALGRITTTIAAYTDGTPTDSSNQTTRYAYDGEDHVLSMTAILPGGTFQTTQYLHGASQSRGDGIDSNDVLIAVRYPDLTTGEASSSEQETFTTNALGQMIDKMDRNGSIHSYAYDTLGRMIFDQISTLGTGVDGAIREIGYSYDSAGRLQFITSYDAPDSGSVVNQIKREYNGLGQLTAEYQEHSGAVNTATTPSVRYVYDLAHGGRLVSMTYPDGRVLNYNYVGGIDDAISRLSSISDSSGTLESYDYLGLSTVVGRNEGNGVSLTVALDDFGRTANQKWADSSGTVLDEYTYTYDRNGNVTAKNNALSSAFDDAYTYDDLNRLISDVRNGTAHQSWDLDALGNWSSVTTDGTTQTRTFNAQNQITGISGAATPTYDANGNMLADETGNQSVYDAWNRVVQVKDSGGANIQTYSYDAVGRRITQGAADLYLSTSDQVLEERQGLNVNTQNVWSRVYVNALVERDRDTDADGVTDERLYILQDANFNVTALAGTTGSVLQRYVEDAYGSRIVLSSTWTAATDGYGLTQGLQGGRLDPTTGLYHFGARDYGPQLGRWYQQDPNPAGQYNDGMSLYQLEKSNPTDRRDPDGLEVILQDLGPIDAFGHWQTGDGESVRIIGGDFIEHVRSISSIHNDLVLLRGDLRRKAEQNASQLQPGQQIVVVLDRELQAATMTGSRWGAFGTIHHHAFASIVSGRTDSGCVYTRDYRVDVHGYDRYHSFETSPWGFRHIWYGLSAIGGTIGSLSPHAPHAYDISWEWSDPASAELHSAP